MPIPTFKTPYYIGVGLAGDAATTFDLGWFGAASVGGIKAGDYAVILCNSGGGTSAVTVTPHGGETWEYAANIAMTGTFAGTNPHKLHVFVSRVTQALLDANGGTMPAPTLTRSIAGDYLTARMLGFRGVREEGSAASAIDVFGTFAHSLTTVESSPVDFVQLTTTKHNCLLVGMLGTGDDNLSMAVSTLTLTNGFDPRERFDEGVTTGGGGQIYACTGYKETAGASGVWSGVLTTGSRQFSKISIALMPPQEDDLASLFGDGFGPVVSALTPASGSSLLRHQPITFNLADVDGIKDTILTCRFEGDTDAILIYDAAGFSGRWVYSDVVDTISLGNVVNKAFSIIPAGGWVRAPIELKVNGYDLFGKKEGVDV